MVRAVASVIAGLVTWMVVVTLLNFGLRMGIPGYHAAEANLHFTLAMKCGRLVEAALASIAAGAVVGIVGPSRWTPWLVGILLLAFFLPVHVSLWDRFPVWYHLAFLVPLAPLVAIGRSLFPGARVSDAKRIVSI